MELVDMLLAEQAEDYRDGIYSLTLDRLRYNMNRLEEIPQSSDILKNTLSMLDEPLSIKVIMRLCADVESGVRHVMRYDFGLAMADLLEKYDAIQDKTLKDLAWFHAEFDRVHPFFDGNGKAGKMILFRECLRFGIEPVIIYSKYRKEYLDAFRKYKQCEEIDDLLAVFQKCQADYVEDVAYIGHEVEHSVVVNNLAFAIHGKLCSSTHRVFTDNLEYQLDGKTIKPDVSVIQGKFSEQTAPIIAIEVVSTTTDKWHCKRKLETYWKAGVQECWVVDWNDRVIEVSTNASCKLAFDKVTSITIPEIEIDLKEIFDFEGLRSM